MLQVFLSGHCKSRSGCCIYIHVASNIFQVFFRCFIGMFASVFHLDVAYVCNGFKCFLGVFTSVSDVCFKCFIYLLLYVATVASECFKSGLDVHMRFAWEAAGGTGHVRRGVSPLLVRSLAPCMGTVCISEQDRLSCHHLLQPLCFTM
jgi:hypothetical protein